MTDWKKEQSKKQPPKFQKIAPDAYMQRRNIEEVEHEGTEGEEPYTCWECECRELTAAEYALVVAEDNAAKTEYIAMMSDIDFGED